MTHPSPSSRASAADPAAGVLYHLIKGANCGLENTFLREIIRCCAYPRLPLARLVPPQVGFASIITECSCSPSPTIRGSSVELISQCAEFCRDQGNVVLLFVWGG